MAREIRLSQGLLDHLDHPDLQGSLAQGDLREKPDRLELQDRKVSRVLVEKTVSRATLAFLDQKVKEEKQGHRACKGLLALVAKMEMMEREDRGANLDVQDNKEIGETLVPGEVLVHEVKKATKAIQDQLAHRVKKVIKANHSGMETDKRTYMISRSYWRGSPLCQYAVRRALRCGGFVWLACQFEYASLRSLETLERRVSDKDVCCANVMGFTSETC